MKTKFFPALLLGLTLAVAFALTAGARQSTSAAIEQLALLYFEEFPADNNVIEADALFARMNDGAKMLILDVRPQDAYRKSHLKGAVNLSFFDMSIPKALEKLPDDTPIMVYCQTGQAASQVVVLLSLAGRTAKNVQSGFENAILKTDGHEAMLEQTVNELPAKHYAVLPEVRRAVEKYFKDKMALDGTPFAHFGVSAKTVGGIISEKNDDYLIVSVRQADDYAKDHVPTALNAPFGRGMTKDLTNLPKDKKIIVYCYTGQTAAQTMTILRMLGYEAYFMFGGMEAWNKTF